MYEDMDKMIVPTCICAYTDGFIVGGEGLKVLVFRMNEAIGEFQMMKELNVFGGFGNTSPFGEEYKENHLRSIHIDFATNERILVVTEKRSMYYCDLPKFGEEDDFSQEKGVFKLVADPGHADRITCADLCLRKPYVVTCSLDKTLKVWDYDKKELVFYYHFPEEIVSVAFHPSGYHVVIAFSDRVQFLNLYLGSKDQRRICYREIITKNCSVVTFSNGGGLVAIATAITSGSTTQVIFVYKFYSNSSTPIHSFTGHSARITSMVWSKDDMNLYSCGEAGLIYQWKIRDGERITRGVPQLPNVNDMVLSSDNRTIVFVMDDPKSLCVGNKFADPSAVFSSVCITESNKLIFVGTKEAEGRVGNVGYVRNPLVGTPFEFIKAHDHRGVVCMMVTRHDEYLITCGGDGTVILFKIKDLEGKDGTINDEIEKPCNNIMVTKQEIDELNTAITNLRTQLNDEKNPSSNNLDMTSEIDAIISRRKTEIDSIKQENKDIEQTNQNEIKNTEATLQNDLNKLNDKCAKDIKDLEVFFTTAISDLQETIKDLIRSTEEEENLTRQKYEEAQMTHQMKMEKIEEKFKNELLEKQEAKKRLLDEINNIENYQDGEIGIILQDRSREREELEKKFKEEVERLENTTIKLKNNKLSNEKKLSKHAEAIETLEESIKERKKTHAQLEINHAQLLQTNKELEKILEEKNNKITSKEKNIYELKRRTQELEKYKFVLDFKIKELKMDIIPKEAEIKNLRLQTTLRDKKLKRYNAVNNKLSLVVESLETEQGLLKDTIKTQKQKLTSQSNKIRNFKNSLYDAVQDILDYKTLQRKLSLMNNDKIKKQEINSDIFREYESQLRYLEKSVNMLKRNLEKDKEIHKQDNMRIMKTNVDLIKEINTLRGKVKDDNKADKPRIKIAKNFGKVYKKKRIYNKPHVSIHEIFSDDKQEGKKSNNESGKVSMGYRGSQENQQEVIARTLSKRITDIKRLKHLLRDVRDLEKIHKEDNMEVDYNFDTSHSPFNR